MQFYNPFRSCSVRIKISHSQAAVADGVKVESVGEFILSFSQLALLGATKRGFY